jgi:S-adenosylmethionine hydrolase
MQNKSPIIGLLTDFGLSDHYVGVMKAILVSKCRGVRLIDITHDVGPQNILQGAYLLWASYRFFPIGALIVAVVDPGVGGSREIIGVKTKNHTFLAPKNGLLDLILWEEKVKEVTTIQLEKAKTRSMFPRAVSSTFHGRDIFAPLAAHLVQASHLELLGSRTHVDWVTAPFVEKKSPETKAMVLHIDRFGNVVTNIRSDVRGVRSRRLMVQAGRRRVQTWAENYESIAPDKASLIVGSGGLVEIVMNQRSAAAHLKLKEADRLLLENREY